MPIPRRTRYSQPKRPDSTEYMQACHRSLRWSSRMLRGIEEFTPLQLVQPQLDCVRLYDMSDWDYIQLSNAEICVIWGEGLESFAGTLTSAESGPAVITLADAPLEYAALDDELTDYDYYEHYSGENPNSYLSMERLSAALDALKESLCELYPAYAERFELNYVEARRLMDEALGELAALRESAPDALCAALYEVRHMRWTSWAWTGPLSTRANRRPRSPAPIWTNC